MPSGPGCGLRATDGCERWPHIRSPANPRQVLSQFLKESLGASPAVDERSRWISATPSGTAPRNPLHGSPLFGPFTLTRGTVGRIARTLLPARLHVHVGPDQGYNTWRCPRAQIKGRSRPASSSILRSALLDTMPGLTTFPTFPSTVATHPLIIIDYRLLKAGNRDEIAKLWHAATHLGFW